MAVTPNYGWPVPVATDYVKDGYAAIADLGDAIDATVFALPSGALALVKSQVIGTAVSSVTVTDAFSATYDSYKIIVAGSGVASAGCNLQFTLGASAASYWSGYMTGNLNSNAAFWTGGRAATTGQAFNMEIHNPFIALPTTMQNSYINFDTAGQFGCIAGIHNVSTSYSAFTIAPSSGTLTGGTIYVYGYAKV